MALDKIPEAGEFVEIFALRAKWEALGPGDYLPDFYWLATKSGPTWRRVQSKDGTITTRLMFVFGKDKDGELRALCIGGPTGKEHEELLYGADDIATKMAEYKAEGFMPIIFPKGPASSSATEIRTREE